MDILSSLLLGIVSGLAVAGLLKYKVVLNLLPKSSRRGYLSDLEKKIRQMPFIYKGLDTDIINDFVDVQFGSLNLGTLQLRTSNTLLVLDEGERLQRNHKVLLLGNAGIGKTTFQRRAILTIIDKKSDSKFLYDSENPIPLYIPLKAIDNSEPFPILRYVRDNNPLFANKFGAWRLSRLARSRKLFLFLDGYDEIPFTGGSRNFVQEELGVLLGFGNASDQPLYGFLARCRIWLSSRKEFFEKNPIGSFGSKSHMQKEGVVGLELKGIGNNRIKLVRKIFDKYRTQSKENDYYEFLNEEYLLSEIDNSEEEIKQLSYNPLFLTVMCYIYAQKAIDEENHKVEWAKKFNELILECTELLLHDLDENKARDLPKAHKAALHTRRNPFVKEKKLFLQYFSIQLYFDDKPVFTLAYLKQKLHEFVESESASSSMLQDLDVHKPSKPNVALQLIYQGVFVLVDTGIEGQFYDFPHRRFREVLASKYVNAPDRYERFLASAEGRQFGEFLTVFEKSEIYNDFNFHDKTLALILEKALGHLSSDRFVKLTRQFIKLKPPNYDPSKITGNFLNEAILSDKQFRVSIDLIKIYRTEDDFISKIRNELLSASKTLNYSRFYICSEILSFIDANSLVNILRPLVSSFLTNREILPIILQYLIILDVNRLPSILNKVQGKYEAFLDLCYAIAFNLKNDRFWSQFAVGGGRAFLSTLNHDGRLTLFYFIHKYSPDRYTSLRNLVKFPIKKELFEYVENHHGEEPIKNTEVDRICIISSRTISDIVNFLSTRTTAFLLNQEYRVKERDLTTGQIREIRERRFSVIPLTSDFKRRVAESLSEIEFRIISRSELESFITKSIDQPINELIPPKVNYFKFADLPKEIRTPTAFDLLDDTQEESPKIIDWRDVTKEVFKSQLYSMLKKDIFHEYVDMTELNKIIKKISYKPLQLVSHFE